MLNPANFEIKELDTKSAIQNLHKGRKMAARFQVNRNYQNAHYISFLLQF